VPAAAEIAAVDENRALDLTEALIRHSLVVVEATEAGSRCRMLGPIRVFVAERLAARPDTVDIGRRHAEWFSRLAVQADAPLRGVHQNVWADRLQVEAANIAAAVRWYLEHDRRPLPHLFRVLSLFWILRDHLAEARTWVDQMLPIADSMDPLVRVELLWSAAIVITDVGDDTAAPAARQRLAPAWEAMKDMDPFLYALSALTMAGLSAIEGDLNGALDAARVSTDQLRTMDEPFWTALGMLQVGFLEIVMGRFDDALDHLLEVRQRAARFDSTWLGAWTGGALGNLAIIQGRLDEAVELLDESLRWSVAARTPRTITLCVAAYSRLALALGEPEQAALLAGAADGLRRRAGLRPWPSLRQGELEQMGTIRRALDAGRFDEAFTTGTGLRQQEAVSAIQQWRGIAMDA
jgi:hypothetical protein